MPSIGACKPKTIIVNKRSMAAGYAGLDNELFYMDKTMMVFGNANKVVEDMRGYFAPDQTTSAYPALPGSRVMILSPPDLSNTFTVRRYAS